MAELKFACPHCQQHIAADSGYSGMQINCPSCQGPLVVPGTPPAPVAVSSAPPLPPPPQAPSMSLHRPAPAAATSTSTCPSCNGALPRGAMLCTNCGYNLQTKQRMVAGRAVAMGKPRDPHADNAPWYKTPRPYVGVVALILGVLYFLGRENPAMKLAFLGIALLYYVGVRIMVCVFAFKDSMGRGFLALCIEIYAIYYVFKISDNDLLKVLYGAALLILLALKFALAGE